LLRSDGTRSDRDSGPRPRLGLLNEYTPVFTTAVDIPNGGVLLALPALLVSGLLYRVEKFFRLPAGFYGVQTILLLLAFMALARLRSIESLRYRSPGEFGVTVASTSFRSLGKSYA
jgi:hypothetical protein